MYAPPNTASISPSENTHPSRPPIGIEESMRTAQMILYVDGILFIVMFISFRELDDFTEAASVENATSKNLLWINVRP